MCSSVMLPRLSKRRSSCSVRRCCAATRPSGPSPFAAVIAAAAAPICRTSRRVIISSLAHVSAKWPSVRRQEHPPLHESRACLDSEGTRHALVSYPRHVQLLPVVDGREIELEIAILFGVGRQLI